MYASNDMAYRSSDSELALIGHATLKHTARCNENMERALQSQAAEHLRFREIYTEHQQY